MSINYCLEENSHAEEEAKLLNVFYLTRFLPNLRILILCHDQDNYEVMKILTVGQYFWTGVKTQSTYRQNFSLIISITVADPGGGTTAPTPNFSRPSIFGIPFFIRMLQK